MEAVLSENEKKQGMKCFLLQLPRGGKAAGLEYLPKAVKPPWCSEAAPEEGESFQNTALSCPQFPCRQLWDYPTWQGRVALAVQFRGGKQDCKCD